MTQIAVISGKGGTGKSCISAAFATLNGKVVIADCDVDAANLYILFDPLHEEETVFVSGRKALINYDLCSNCEICVSYCRFDAISLAKGKVVITEISCDGCGLCLHVCPENAIRLKENNKSRMFSGSFRNGKIVYGRLAPGEENSGRLVNMVREKAREVAENNNLSTIILDGPPGIGCPVISTITGADKVVIVTEPSISGLSDLKRVFEVIRKFGMEAHVIINKYDLNQGMSREIDAWCKKMGAGVAGFIPFDPQIVEAMVQCKSIIEYNNKSEISISIKKIWKKIINTNNNG